MNEFHENFFSDNVFRYKNALCDFRINTEDIAIGIAPKTLLKMQAKKDSYCNFAFTTENGLIRCGKEGALLESDIVGKLIALPESKEKEIKRFFEKNGFLFPIESDHLTTIDTDDLWAILNRVKALVLLMSAMGGRKNYNEILHYVAYLLYSDSIKFEINGEKIYETCTHDFNKWMTNAFDIPEADRRQDIYSDEEFCVPDTLYPPFYMYDIATYYNVIEGTYEDFPGSQSPAFRSLLRLYINADGQNAPRKTIDFFLHYQEKIGVFRDVTIDKIEYYSTPKLEQFSIEMKNALIEIAKKVAADEINHNIMGIYPSYDQNRMQPAWKINNLLQAAYFSLFFNKPDMEIYRKCANPNCKNAKYFIAKTTMQRKKYCCPECANADAQRRHRLKMLKKLNENSPST